MIEEEELALVFKVLMDTAMEERAARVASLLCPMYFSPFLGRFSWCILTHVHCSDYTLVVFYRGTSFGRAKRD